MVLGSLDDVWRWPCWVRGCHVFRWGAITGWTVTRWAGVWISWVFIYKMFTDDRRGTFTRAKMWEVWIKLHLFTTDGSLWILSSWIVRQIILTVWELRIRQGVFTQETGGTLTDMYVTVWDIRIWTVLDCVRLCEQLEGSSKSWNKEKTCALGKKG